MSKQIEKNLQNKFIALLKRENILYLKTHGGISYLPQTGGGFKPIIQKKGFSDLIIFWEGRTIFVELKTDEGKLRESQIEIFKKLFQQNYYCCILRPKHWEQAKLSGKLNFIDIFWLMEWF